MQELLTVEILQVNRDKPPLIIRMITRCCSHLALSKSGTLRGIH